MYLCQFPPDEDENDTDEKQIDEEVLKEVPADVCDMIDSQTNVSNTLNIDFITEKQLPPKKQ